MRNNLKELDFKIRVINLLKILNLLLAMMFTLGGTVSIVSLLMYLNEVYEFSFFGCFVMTIILPNILSPIFNSLLKPLDMEIKKMNKEIELVQKESLESNLSNDNVISESIKNKFDSLSRDNRIKLLNFIRDNLTWINGIEELNKLSFDDMLLIMKEIDNIQYEEEVDIEKGYSKKRTIESESNVIEL